MTPKIIGICGVAGSGKSTVADHLRRHGFSTVSLAAPMKQVVGELFGFTIRQLYGPSAARSEPHPRYRRPDGSPLTARFALQTFGTDWARACCPDIWIEKTLEECRRLRCRVAIPDVRFRNEMDAIRAAGGLLWRRTSDVASVDQHPSEREQLELPDSYFDAVFPHYPDLTELYARVDFVAAGLVDGR